MVEKVVGRGDVVKEFPNRFRMEGIGFHFPQNPLQPPFDKGGSGGIIDFHRLVCIELSLGNFDKTFAWSTADRALVRGCLFDRITANGADIIIQDVVFPQVLQGF